MLHLCRNQLVRDGKRRDLGGDDCCAVVVASLHASNADESRNVTKCRTRMSWKKAVFFACIIGLRPWHAVPVESHRARAEGVACGSSMHYCTSAEVAPSSLETTQIMIRLPEAGSEASTVVIGRAPTLHHVPNLVASRWIVLGPGLLQIEIASRNRSRRSPKQCGVGKLPVAAGFGRPAASDNKQYWCEQ